MANVGWEQTKELLHKAIEAPASERAAFLSEACAGDDELRNELETLIHASDEAGDFLEEPLIDLHPLGSSDFRSRFEIVEGTEIGPYRVKEPIGRGGMGEVFLAAGTGLVRRDVALKVIKPGMDTRLVLQRFRSEQQALGRMNHPNIAVAYDFGATQQGRPYFAMEYVPGVPITDYADEQELSMQQRLQLVLEVCKGVQHAHRKGIIHRDLKPSNLLVRSTSEGPLVKVIDFGIAKAVDQEGPEPTIVDGAGAWMGTPEYMSPEQAKVGTLDVDTRTDVYSVGVVLYELLTGMPPFRRESSSAESLDSLRHTLLHQNPLRPSVKLRQSERGNELAAKRGQTSSTALARQLDGDLDWITLKALAKAPEDRYDSPSALAEDIERHLSNHPVQACPPSRTTAAKKFVGRNWVALAGVSLLVLSVGFAVIAGLRARYLSEQEADLARLTSSFLQGLFNQSNPHSSTALPKTAEEVLGQANQAVRSLETRPVVLASVLLTLADLSRIYGDYEEAEKLANEVLSIRREQFGSKHPSIAEPQDVLAQVADRRTEHELSLELFQSSLDLRLSAKPANQAKIAQSWCNLGMPLVRLRRHEEASQAYRRCIELYTEHLGEDHPDIATPRHNQAWASLRAGDLEGSEAQNERALAIRIKAFGPDSYPVAKSLDLRARIYRQTNRLDLAEQDAQRSLKLLISHVRPQDLSLAQAYNSLGNIQFEREDYAGAAEHYLQALDIRTVALGANSPRLAAFEYNLGETYLRLNDPSRAEEHLLRAVSLYEDSEGKDAPEIAAPLACLGHVARQRGQLARAESMYLRALDIWGDGSGEAQERRAATLGLIEILEATGRPQEASEWRRKLPSKT